MKITTETSLRNFKAWSGAVETLERIVEEGQDENLESQLEDLYPEGMTDVELNDLLWFDSETVYEWLGMTPDE